MATFNKFIQSFSKEDKKKGKQFEQFVKHFLKDDRHGISKIKQVWSFKDSPINWGADTGTDLIFEDYDKNYWAVQAKKYDPEYSVTKEDINSFISDSNRTIIYKRLLIISTNKIAKNGLKTINAQEKEVKIFRLQNFEDMGDIFPEKLTDLIKFQSYNIPTPKPHQTIAIEDVLKEFKIGNKGQLIMACGTGKTFTCFWIHQRLESKKTLVLLPSLNLISQMLKEWIFANGSSFRSLCVCSDSTTIDGIQEDEIIIERSDLPYSVTSNVNEIKAFLSRKEPTVVFSTYQSSPLIAEAQAKLKSHHFELSIADEAHRCAGKVSSNFATILDDKKIRSNKKLFATATPRIYSTGIKKTLGFRDIKITDMNDKSRFGKVFHYFPFSKAIEKNQLADYKVIIIGIDKQSIKEMIEKRELVSFSDDNLTDSKSLANQIGFIKALNDYNLRKIITFHGRVKKSKDFSEIIPKTFAWIKPKFKPNQKLITGFVQGKMSASDRLKKIKILKESKTTEVCVLSNARCLGEGVDVPSLDAVSFIDPKTSDIDIIQSVGRAIRKPSKKKKYGYIILPVYVTKKESVLDTIESSDFKYIWHILNALKAHDDNLKFELDLIRTNLGKKGTISKPSKIIFDLPAKIDKSFQNEINTYLINNITDSWHYMFGKLEAYLKKNNNLNIRTDDDVNAVLYRWINKQRAKFKNNKLQQWKIEKLDKIDKWLWDPNEAHWQSHYDLLKEYLSKHSIYTLKNKLKFKGFDIGNWASKQRGKWKLNTLSSDRKLKLDKLKNWIWDHHEYAWMQNYLIVKKLAEKKDISKLKVKDYKYEGLDIGKWLSNQRSIYGKNQKCKKALLINQIKNWSWNPVLEYQNKMLNLAKEYSKKNNLSDVPYHLVYKSLPLGQWLSNQRSNYKQRKIYKTRYIALELSKIKSWIWNKEQAYWEKGFNVLKKFLSQNKTSSMKEGLKFDGFTLGSWVSRQRLRYRKTKDFHLTEDFKKLDNLKYWSWDPKNEIIKHRIKLLKEYIKESKNKEISSRLVYKNEPLGKWFYERKRAYRLNLKNYRKSNWAKELNEIIKLD